MDETRRADTDLRLLESEQRYQAVIQNASDMIQSVRPDGTFEFVNAAWHRILGYTVEDLAAMIIWDIIHPEAMNHCQVEFAKAITGEPIAYMETTFISKDGRAVPVEGSVTSRFLGAEVVATHGFFRDVTERHRARELEERAERLEREERARYLEKMAALGKLSAGLAHELNNPAAAIQRAASGLQETLARRDKALNRLLAADLDPAGFRAIDDLLEHASAARRGADADPVELSERETELEEWLDDRGFDEPWNIASGLAEGGVTVSELAALASAVPEDTLSCTVAWVTTSLAARESTEIITQSSRRISDLVRAIKGYSHMDRATELEADIHEGIENTLVILAHRLRNIQIERHYDRTLAPIQVYGNSLNQVWTNLLDNAIDAMDGAGTIRIRTGRTGDRTVVEIEDTGSGIPPEALPRIFEPFYTSKPQGQGTGLGLDTVWRIITEEHGGSVSAESSPGQTVFRVTLPGTGIAAPPDAATRDR